MLYPPELQGQKTPKALPTKSLQPFWACLQTAQFRLILAIAPLIAPLTAPKAPKMTKTFQGTTGGIAPNGYKGFGANQRQDWVQEKDGMRLRNPVLYPPELQGQKTPKAIPAKSLQWSETTVQTARFHLIWLIVSSTWGQVIYAPRSRLRRATQPRQG